MSRSSFEFHCIIWRSGKLSQEKSGPVYKIDTLGIGDIRWLGIVMLGFILLLVPLW